MHRVNLAGLVCLLLMSGGGWDARGGTAMKASGKALFWKDGKVTLRVSRTVHPEAAEGAAVAGVDRRDAAAAVHTAVWQAVQAWTKPGRAKVEVDLGFTDEQKHGTSESVVTFTDPAPFDTGLCNKETFIACTILSFSETGEILTATVAFNPYKKHSVSGFDGTHDIGLIMMHEMGHVFGLDHSAVLDSVLLPQTELDTAGAVRQFALRELSEDDLNSLAALYPPDAGGAAISGVVKRATGGAAVAGAHVFALEPATGRVVHGAFTNAEGAFRLSVPAAGDFTLGVEPLDGPVLPAQFLSPMDASDPFQSKLVTEPVTVAAGGERSGIEIAVSDPTGVNADSIGVVAGGFYLGGPRVSLARGRTHSLALTRSPLSGLGTLEFPAVSLTAAGNINSPPALPQLVRQNVTAPATGKPGSFLAAYRHPDGLVMFPGGVRVVAGPRVSSVGDGAETPVLRAGQRVTLRGTDLALRTETYTPGFETALLPTQLGGIAVRLADRYVPLVSVSPEEVVFEVLSGLASGNATLTVVAGTQMESEPVPVVVE